MNLQKYLIEEDEGRRKKWAYLTEGLEDRKRLQTEVLLQNMQWYLSEEATTANVGAFTTYAFPMIRRIFPKLIAQSLVSVQPMTQPTGKVFYLDFKYGTAKAPTVIGDNLADQGKFNKTFADATEGNPVRELNFDITSQDVSAEEKKLKAIWTMETQQDLKAYHGLDAETEIMGVASEEIIREVDMVIIDDLVTGATAGNVNWTKAMPQALPWTALDPKIYAATLYDAIVDANNLIFKKRYRNASWLVADSDTCTRLEKLEGFKLTETADDAIYNVGIHQFGIIRNRWMVYKHPWFQADKILVGYKGASWLDTGYVYCPYIPLYTTPLIVDPNDFKPRRGLMSRYAKKMVVGDCYATVTLI